MKYHQRFVACKHYQAIGTAAGGGAISTALDLLEARAQIDAPQRAVHLRVADHDDRIYLDLADERWRAVEIGPDGWQVISCPPVDSAGQPACCRCRCRCRSEADRSRRSLPFAIFRLETISF